MADLAITSLGLLSSIGLDVETACSSMRAGLSRPGGIVGGETVDLVDGKLAPLIVHALRDVSCGFCFTGLWVRMIDKVIGDVVRYANLPPLVDVNFWSTCHLFLVLPAMDLGRFPLLAEEGAAAEPILSAVVQGLSSLTGIQVRRENIHTITRGHVGVAAALDRAAQGIASGSMQRCLVVAVDSYVDLDTIDWLGRRRRLKCDDNPVGLSPGEAAAALLVESPRAAKNRSARVEAWVRAVSLLDTKRPESADVPNRDGSIISDAIAAVLPAGKPFRGDLIADLNGEEWRAREFGGALARLGGALGDVRFIYPAASLGETGASSGAIALCLAARAFRREYAKSNASLVVSLSDAGEAAGIRVEAPS